jgi:hypothetical protein
MFSAAFALSYLIVHSAVESDSPSMLIVLYLRRMQKCDIRVLEALIRDASPQVDRAEKLYASPLVSGTGKGLHLTRLGWIFLFIVSTPRWIAGRRRQEP